MRRSYLTSPVAERQIGVVTKAVAYSSKQLRFAQLRLAKGAGTNLDVMAAQRDYIFALSRKADAIVPFKTACVQLLAT